MMILVDLPFEWPKQGQADDHFDIGETYGVQAAEIGDGERGGGDGGVERDRRRSFVRRTGDEDDEDRCPIRLV